MIDTWTNSPCEYLRKCIENSMEKLHTDVTVQKVKATAQNNRV